MAQRIYPLTEEIPAVNKHNGPQRNDEGMLEQVCRGSS